MFLKKLEKFYSYNLLSILGWLSFILSISFYMKFLFIPLLTGNETIDGTSTVFVFIFITYCSVFFLVVSLFLALIELIFSIRKKKVSDNKNLSQLKLIGVLLVLLPIILTGSLFIIVDISPTSYDMYRFWGLCINFVILPILILSYFSYRRKKNK